MDASHYPITTDYGYIPGYPLNNGFHRGQDRAMPVGTSVIVNDTTIGLSGSTGASTGPHLHIGKWVNGAVQPPNGQGFSLSSPTVFDTGNDADNGNFVRLRDAQGVIWVYLHLSQINVKAGQVLQGEPMADDNITTLEYGARLGRNPNQAELDSWRGRPTNLLITSLATSDEGHAYYNKVKAALDGTTAGYTPVTETLYRKK